MSNSGKPIEIVDPSTEHAVEADPAAPVDELSRHEAAWTPRQVHFAKAYMMHGNGARAVREAGYNIPFAAQTTYARRLMRLPHIRAFIKSHKKITLESMKMSDAVVLGEVAKVAMSNLGELLTMDKYGKVSLDLTSLTKEQAAAISEITTETYVENTGEIDDDTGELIKVPVTRVKIKLGDKLKALEMLGRNRKLWTDVMETNERAAAQRINAHNRYRKLRGGDEPKKDEDENE